MMKPLCVIAVLALCGYAVADDGVCALSKHAPAVPVKLRFCKQYRDMACCLPAHDDENRELFEALVDVGKGCYRYIYHELRQFYCLGCSNLQPSYVDGDNIRVCESYAKALAGAESANEARGKKYDSCGLKVAGDCDIVNPVNPDEDPIGATGDPYECGDDLVIPSVDWAVEDADLSPEALDKQFIENFMDNLKPPGLDDFNFVVVPDPVEGVDSPACFNSASTTATSVVFVAIASLVALLF